MPEGTEIVAAREGIVVDVVKNNTESCPKAECAQFNNYVTILHPDGTFATYMHIKYNGTQLNRGDSVKRGDVIALSGNTGWSSAPHLHFVSYTPTFNKWNTLQTKFKINNGDESAILLEANTYSKNY